MNCIRSMRTISLTSPSNPVREVPLSAPFRRWQKQSLEKNSTETPESRAQFLFTPTLQQAQTQTCCTGL